MFPHFGREIPWPPLRRFALLVFILAFRPVDVRASDMADLLERLGVDRGICVVLGAADAALPIELAQASDLIVYVQSPDAAAVDALRHAADRAGLLGTRIYVSRGGYDRIHLATNLADALLVAPAAETGGNIVSPTVYDIHTGKCLNTLANEWLREPDKIQEKFPSHPQKTMFQRAPRGRELFLVDGQVACFGQADSE